MNPLISELTLERRVTISSTPSSYRGNFLRLIDFHFGSRVRRRHRVTEARIPVDCFYRKSPVLRTPYDLIGDSTALHPDGDGAAYARRARPEELQIHCKGRFKIVDRFLPLRCQ